MNLVVGATGLLGGEVCRILAATAQPVRALVRPAAQPAKVADLAGLGIEIAEGDLRDRTSLERVTAVISTAWTWSASSKRSVAGRSRSSMSRRKCSRRSWPRQRIPCSDPSLA